MNTKTRNFLILAVFGLAVVFYFYTSPDGGGLGARTPSKLVVLFWREFEDTEDTVPQSDVVQAYLQSHSYIDGGTPAWRDWDNDTDYKKESPLWVDVVEKYALQYGDADPPIMIISDGTKDGTIIPMPKTPAEAVKELQKWGGP